MKNSIEIKNFAKALSVCAVDIGNSRIKILFRTMSESGIIDDNYSAIEYLPDWELKVLDFFEELSQSSSLYYSSVNGGKSGAFLKLAYKYNFNKIENVKKALKRQNIVDFSDIKGIGDDRALGLIGASSFAKPPLITVDCGTAITVNAVDKTGKCSGGAIFAGIFTQLKALAAEAEGLTNILPEYLPFAAGKNTRDALSSGIILSAAGGAAEFIKRITKQEFGGKKPKIILTGGTCNIISRALNDCGMKHICRPMLVLEGILKLAS